MKVRYVYILHKRIMFTFCTMNLRTRKKKKEVPSAPYACSLCDFRSYTTEGIVAHIARAHVSAKPFACARCDFRCAQHSSFRTHQVRHGTLVCGECEFASLSGGAGHGRSHARDLPYGCDRCAFRARSLDELQQHVTVHGGVPSSCNACMGVAARGAGRRLCASHAAAAVRLSTVHLCQHCHKLCVQRLCYRSITIHLHRGGSLY